MRHHRVVAGLLLLSSLVTPALSAAPVAADGGTRQIASGGSAQLVSRADGPDGVQDPEFAREPEGREGAEGKEVELRKWTAPGGRAAVAAAAQQSSTARAARDPRVTRSFEGLNLRNQRLANGGNQFTVEPPDQGLCVGNGFVVESVNDVLRIFDTAGNPLTGVIDLNTFYGYPAQFNRTTGAQGPFVTDPTCVYDGASDRFYHVVLTLEVFPDTGEFTGANHLDLAVSRTGNPVTGGWNIYRIDATDDGLNGTPNHGCPAGDPAAPPPDHPPLRPKACIGDFPHIGADRNGIYLTTNEYCLFCEPPDDNPTGFHAAQIYALDKRALASGSASVTMVQIDTLGRQSGKPGFTVWPATSPVAGDFEGDAGGTEYFTSSNAAEEVSNVPNSRGTNKSDQIVTWAVTNTSSLKGGSPNLSLRNTRVTVSEYSVPGPSNQKAGPFPLGQCINDTTMPTPFGPGCWQMIFVDEPEHNEVEGTLDSSDSRVLSTVFARGLLYGTLDTNVIVGDKTKAGVLYYVIAPHLANGGLSASLTSQGHIAVPNNNVIYGTAAATHTGRAIVSFTLTGDNHYPSAAYVSLNDPSDIKIVSEGVGPQDGFSEYKAFRDPPRPRWGDYGAAVATSGSTIWMAAEYIGQSCTLQQYYPNPSTDINVAAVGFGSCGARRVTLGNWATRVAAIQVTP